MGTIREGRKPSRWRESDRLLAVALTIFEDSLHHRCGHPREVAFNPDSEGWFTVHESVCQACAALDQHSREQEGKERPAGAVVSVANELPAGVKLRPMS